MCTFNDTPNDWRKQVYEPLIDDRPLNWETIKYRVARRDKFKCQMCECAFDLTCHHIKPRSEGGSHDEYNLITLCWDCHNKVELEGVQTAELIRGWFPQVPKENKPVGTHWTQWVYGGYRRPA